MTLASGDVLTGAITYFYDSPSEVILYDEMGVKKVYEPKQVQTIKLDNGEKFITKYYRVNNDSSALLLQSLIESPGISLMMMENNATVYYYVSKGNTLYRLENNDVEVRQGGTVYKRKDNKYIGTLSSLMANRFDLLEGITKTSLNEKDLTKLVLDYNKGNISYSWRSDNASAKEHNWVFFAQYSHYGSSPDNPVTSRSSGQMLGLQYYFSKHSRHSLKVSFDHSYHRLGGDRIEATGLGFRYEYAFKKAETYGVYLLVQLADVAYLVETEEGEQQTYSHLALLPGFSPGLGFEVKPWSKLAFYAEINYLLRLDEIPKSFSVGLKYDFGKTSW